MWTRDQEELVQIDCDVITLMTDEQLKTYIPAYGDRIALMAYASKEARRAHVSSDSEPGTSSQTTPMRGTKRKYGNSNAIKATRRVEMGWLHQSPDDKCHKQVNSRSGGGTRNLSVLKTCTIRDLLTNALDIFFPGGVSKMGRLTDMLPEMRDFKGDVLVYDKTVETVYGEGKMKMLKLYLYTSHVQTGTAETMAQETRSSLKRKEGNSILLTVADNLAPCLRINRYQVAANCYIYAYYCAENDDERSSAAKNSGVVYFRMGRISAQAGDHWNQVKNYFKEALKNFNLAFTTGVSCNKPMDWSNNILASCRDCWEELSVLVEALSDSDNVERIGTIREFIDYIPIPDIKADCYMEIADYHFHRGIVDIDAKNFKSCLSHMHECHFPMHEAMRFGSSSACLRQRFETLEEDIVMHTGLAQSLQSREIGDHLFNQVVMDEETLNTEMIWEVIDWYKDSILKVRGLDVKSEAISLSRLGMVYERVLKIRFRAKDYLGQALELAHAITPMNVTIEQWYKDTYAILERYQKETISYEQEEDRKRKAAVREKIKPQTDLLDTHKSDSHVDFLKFVYTTFKPKKKNQKLNLEEEGEMDDKKQKKLLQKKLLQKAVIHYHPDRVSEGEHGLEEKVLHEEITKHLTQRYQSIKLS